jgi:hypothetical protein
MSTVLVDISYSLIDALYGVLYGNVTYLGVTYPVYKSIPKPAPSTYVLIGQINSIENGTKDYFIYEGTVNIMIVDDKAQRADKKLAYCILNVVRGLLKPNRLSVPSLIFGYTADSELITADSTLITADDESGGLECVSFTPGVFNDFVEINDTGYSRIRLIDQYNFIIN